MKKEPSAALISAIALFGFASYAWAGSPEDPPNLVCDNDPGQFTCISTDAVARTYELIDLRKAGLDKPKVAEKFKKLCREARTSGAPVQIGMSRIQAHAAQWCLPWGVENTTTTANGTFVQESYLKTWDHWPYQTEPQFRRYLYFTNGVLTAIQE